MAATTRSQFLDYNLVRSGRLNPIEHGLLNIIMSYSSHCSLRQEDIAKMINRSVATVKRATASLVSKGLIKKRYTTFKRCVLSVVSMDEQKLLLSGVGVIRQVYKRLKSKIKRPDSSSVSCPDSSSVSQPTRNETQEIKTEKSELNLMRKLTERQFGAEKQRQLAEFQRMYSLN